MKELKIVGNGCRNDVISRITNPQHTPVNNSTNIQLHHGECLGVMAQLPERSVDFVCCDLPYAVTQQEWDSLVPTNQLWQAYDRVCKPAASIVLTATNPFASLLIASQPQWFRYDMVWLKNKTTGFLNAGHMPLRQHELVLVFRKNGKGTYHPQKSTGHAPVNAVTLREKSVGPAVYGSLRKRTASGGATERHPTSVLHFAVVNNDDPNRIHRNQKPVALLEFLIRTYSNPGEVVLDNTMGSGSTGVACLNTGRSFVGIEKDAEFFVGAVQRIDKAAKALVSRHLDHQSDCRIMAQQ